MVGIDVAKATLAVCCWETGQPAPTWERPYPNTEAGIQELLASTAPEWPWVLEPTGPYSEPVVRLAQAAGRTVLQANPLAAKRFLQSLHPRAKTDKVDARGLARFGQERRLAPYTLKEPSLQRLGELLRVRRALSRSLATLRQQRQVLSLVAPETTSAVQAVRAELARLDKELQAAGRAQELFGRLQTVPGIGPVTAAALTVHLRSRTFPRADAFVAYLGLDVRVRDSGTRRGRRSLTKQGDAQGRWLLFLAAQSSLRSRRDPQRRAFYERKQQEGHSSTAVCCMLARKLARTAWSLDHTGQSYDPARVFAPPAPTPQKPMG